MAVVIAIGLALLGVASAVVGIVALRDDAPRWTLKIKRPGWLIPLGLVLIVVAWVINANRYDFAEQVTEFVGQPVTCDGVGSLEVEGDVRDVYACENERGTHLGCFVRVDDAVVDVSLRAEAEGTGEAAKPDC